MSSRELLEPIMNDALDIMVEREPLYGDSWTHNTIPFCLAEVNRKAAYLKVQLERNIPNPAKFDEDLLDIINWAACTYWHRKQEQEK